MQAVRTVKSRWFSLHQSRRDGSQNGYRDCVGLEASRKRLKENVVISLYAAWERTDRRCELSRWLRKTDSTRIFASAHLAPPLPLRTESGA